MKTREITETEFERTKCFMIVMPDLLKQLQSTDTHTHTYSRHTHTHNTPTHTHTHTHTHTNKQTHKHTNTHLRLAEPQLDHLHRLAEQIGLLVHQVGLLILLQALD